MFEGICDGTQGPAQSRDASDDIVVAGKDEGVVDDAGWKAIKEFLQALGGVDSGVRRQAVAQRRR